MFVICAKYQSNTDYWEESIEVSLRMKIKPYFSDHPDFPQFDDIEDDLNKVENTWGLFDEFHTSMKEMANEEWILFR